MTKRKNIIAIVLSVILIVGVVVGVILLTRKDNKSEYDLSAEAVVALAKANDKIYETYAKNEYNSGVLSQNLSVLRSTQVTLTQANEYFNVFGSASFLPYMAEFVVNTKDSSLYQNKFSLNQTYFATSGSKVTYLAMAKHDGKVYLSMDYKGELAYYCVINYEYANQTVLSATTFAWNSNDKILTVLNTNVANNTLYGLNLLGDVGVEDFNKALNGTLTYDNFVDGKDDFSTSFVYSANIANNVNAINMNRLDVEKDNQACKAHFNSIVNHIDTVPAGVQNLINTDDALSNSAMVDAEKYAEAKVNVRIVDNAGDYELYHGFVSYDKHLEIMNALLETDGFKNDNTISEFFENHVNFVTRRGKTAYVGHKYRYNNQTESIQLTRIGEDAYQIETAFRSSISTVTFDYKNGVISNMQSV